MARADGLSVSVVGATGVVGGILLDTLARRRLPVGRLRVFSYRRKGPAARFRGRSYPAPAIDAAALRSSDVVFLVSSDEVSKAHAPALVAAGVWIIDDSSAFRMDPGVPLVIPEVNADALSRRKRLIAGPNCTV